MTNQVETLEAIDDALENEDYDQALLLASDAVRNYPDDPLLQAAYGDALWALDDIEDARRAYSTALQLDPNEPDSWAALAQLHFQLSDFGAAREAALRCLNLEQSADALEVLSRIAERNADLAHADDLASRANALDSDCVIPFRVSESEFQDLVRAALEDIPDRFRDALYSEVAIIVEPVPPLDLLQSETPPLDPELLGLYVGTPLPERDAPVTGAALPDQVFIFQRNLEHIAADRDELIEQIRITLFHEIGHHFGFSDEDLEARDFG